MHRSERQVEDFGYLSRRVLCPVAQGDDRSTLRSESRHGLEQIAIPEGIVVAPGRERILCHVERLGSVLLAAMSAARLTTMSESQVRNELRPLKPARPRNARSKASWAMSSAAALLPVTDKASRQAAGQCRAKSSSPACSEPASAAATKR